MQMNTDKFSPDGCDNYAIMVNEVECDELYTITGNI